MDSRPDCDLIDQLRSAQSDALETLLCRYWRLVYRIAADILRDSGEAEDITQEVFFEIYSKAHQYDASRGTVKVWLLQFAYHRSLSRRAALRRRCGYQGESLDCFERQDVRSFRDLTQQECTLLVRSGLVHLSAKQRETLELVCFDGLNLQEAAQQLRVSWGSARHYYYRALKNLRKWFNSPGVVSLKHSVMDQRDCRD